MRAPTLAIARLLALVVLVGLLGACATAPPGSAGDLGLLELTAQARAWVRQRVPGAGEPAERLRTLAASLTLPQGLDLQEDRRTRTAAQTFAMRKGNCVAVAFLFVALARELELPAYFVLSETVEDRQRRGDLVVEDLHLAAAFGPPERPVVFDLGGEDREAVHFRPISDTVAAGIFHSNRGAELLQQGQFDRALAHLKAATKRAPELPLVWTNLGVVRRRQGDAAGADAAFRQAILLAPDSLAAWRNLALLLDGDR